MLFGQVNVRVPADTYEELNFLSTTYGSKTAAVIEAIKLLYQRHNQKIPPVLIDQPQALTEPKNSHNKRVDKDDQMQDVLKEVARLQSEENLGARSIARTLNESGSRNSKGQLWTRDSVRWLQEVIQRNKYS